MSSEKCEISDYMMNYRDSEQSPMRSNYLLYRKAKRSKSGHRITKSPSEFETRQFEDRGHARKRQSSNINKLLPRKSGSDLCLEDLKKQRKRGLLATTLLSSTHEAWDSGHSFGACGTPATSIDKFLEQKQMASFKKTQEHEGSILDKWNNHKTNCSLTKPVGAVPETHKNSTHFERLFADKNTVNEFAALNAALPPKKLFFMQEYPCKLLNPEAKQTTAEMAGCNNRRSYIEKSRNLFGFSHKLLKGDKLIFPETCQGRYEIPVRSVECPHAAAMENDHEIYASYIGDHCRKNRRGRNSNKNFNLLPQSNADVDAELGLRNVRGDSLKKSIASFDSHNFSDLSSEYPISDLDERPFENCNFSHVPSQKELNFNAFINDKKKLKKVRRTKEKSATIAKKHDKRGRCRSRGDVDDGWDSSVSESDKSSQRPKRRTKKKRQRSGTKKASYKHNMQEEEYKNCVSKHYNEHRRHSSKDVDRKAVSRFNDNTDEIEHKHRSESKTRRKHELLDEPIVFIENADHFKPRWTCTKWVKENINKTKQDSTASHWAYEVYSDTCLNPSMNGLQIGVRNQRGNEEDVQECSMPPEDRLRETNQGYRQPVLCSVNITNLPSDKPYTLAECNLTYNRAPNVRIMPVLAAKYSPMIAGQAEGESRQLTRTMWSQLPGSEDCRLNIDSIDRAINTSHSGRNDHRMPAENKSNRGEEDEYNSQEINTAVDSYNLGKCKKEAYIKKLKHETCLNQTNYTKERHNKLLEYPQSTSSVKEDIEVPTSDITSKKSQCSVDEKLIRTVHSIKIDIESVFDRLNSLDVSKDDSVVKTALSLKDSVKNVLVQAKTAKQNSSDAHVITAAEIIKSALKTLTSFKTTSAASKKADDDPRELSYEMYKKGQQTYNAGDSSERSIQIVSIDATRKPYVRVEKRIDCKNVMPSTKDNLSDTDATSCSTVRPKQTSNNCTENALCISTNEKRERRKHYNSRLSNRTVTENDKSVVESTILKKPAHSREKSPSSSAETKTSSAESTYSRKSRETAFEQKFEEMLARFPPDEREFQVNGFPESLARSRKRLSPVGKTKKKRKVSPYGKMHNASISKNPLYQDNSAADETSSLKTTKRKHGTISGKKMSHEHEKMKAASEMLSRCQTGVMMQPQISTKEKTSGDTSMEPVASSLAQCEVTDIAGTMEAAPGLKKYREQMLQPTSELDDALESGSDADTILLTESMKSLIGTTDLPKTTRDIQIIYKISSKTTLTEDDKSIINAICLRKTEEEIMAVPYDSENTSPTIRQKGLSDPCSTDKSKDVGNASGDQLWGSRSNNTDAVQESGSEMKGLRLPSEESKSASANSLFGHDQPRQMEMSKEILSSEINRLSSSEFLEKDVTNVDSSFCKEYHLTKQTKAMKSSEQQEMSNSLCNISELTENVVVALDSNKEPSIESFGKLVSACKELQGAQHNKALEMQANESYDTAISSGYVKTRETTELLLPDSGTSVNCQREECIQIKQNETREKPTNKANKNEASDVLDNTTVSMLNASIIKLYEEVNKLRVKLESSEENSKLRSSQKADKRNSRSYETSTKKKSSKDSSSKSVKSSSSTQSSRASSRGYKAASDDDERSCKKDHYFARSPVYSAMQKAIGERLSQTEITTSPMMRQYCCSFRKYDASCPETILEYYDKKSKGKEQVPRENSDNFYLEYEPQCISPAMYIEHKSQNPSPASYMEMDDDDSSVASYAKQTVGPQEDSDAKQNFQYFEKNLSRCVCGRNMQDKAAASSNNYWSEFSTVSPNKPEIIEATNDQNREPDGPGMIGIGKFDDTDVTDNLFPREQSNSGIVQEYLSRDKQSIVEYTSNTLTAEGIGLQLNELAANVDSESAQQDCHLLDSNESCGQKDDFGKYNLPHLEPDQQIPSTVNCGSGLLTVDCHTNENSETATEKTQNYSNDNENTCDVNLVAKEEHNTDLSNTFETVVSDDNEQRSNLPPSASEHNACVDVNSNLNSNPPTWSNSAENYSKENVSNVSNENLHQSSSEDKSEQTGEPVKTPTPPMWSDSEESLGKNEEDYIASLHIPRIVQCVRDIFFGSTKAQSKEGNRQSSKPYDWRSGTSTSSKGMSPSNSEMTHSHSRCQPAASDTDDDVIGSFSSTWRRQSHNENVKDDDSDAVTSPLQQNYIFRKKASRINTESQASPSTESLKKASLEVDEANEESPHYSEYSWTGKDIGNYNFVGSNILLTSNPFIQCRSVGYLPAFKHVEETDKAIRHYCDAINSNTSKRLPSLYSRCASIPKTAGSEGSSSARMCNSTSEDDDEREMIMGYGRTPVLENCNVPAQNDWSSSQNGWSSAQDAGCFPKWQSQMTPSPMLGRYPEDDILPYCESTMQQRRPCYVDHCGFRQKRCDNFENGLCGQERGLNGHSNHDAVTCGVHKSTTPGVNDSNSSHEVTRKEGVQGQNDTVKRSQKLLSSAGMFYVNEGTMDNVPFECSKKLDSSVSKNLFTWRDVSETKQYSSCSNIRSVDYGNGGLMKHYKQEPRRDQAEHAKEDVEKSKTVYEEALEKRGKGVAEDDDERVSVSDDEDTDIDAISDDTSMEDDERESWYKTTDDESNG